MQVGRLLEGINGFSPARTSNIPHERLYCPEEAGEGCGMEPVGAPEEEAQPSGPLRS